MSDIRIVIFDLDGTILDTLRDLHDSLDHVLAAHGLPERSMDEVRRFVGNGLRRLVERAVPQTAGTARTESVYADFRKYYAEHAADTTRPYPGIPELLAELKARGVSRAVVSNKADKVVRKLCADYFPGLLDAAVGEIAGRAPKPSPDAVHAVLEELSLRPGDAVYVGDSEVDVETAKNAGLSALMVSWGFRTPEELRAAGAGRIVSGPEEILEAVLGPDREGAAE